jgi:hypothetical protein
MTNGPGAASEFCLFYRDYVEGLLERMRLGSTKVPRLVLRAILPALLVWLPLLLLDAADSGRAVPLIRDFSFHVRFLFIVPLLILIGPAIDIQTRMVALRFASNEMIPPENKGRFVAAVWEANHPHPCVVGARARDPRHVRRSSRRPCAPAASCTASPRASRVPPAQRGRLVVPARLDDPGVPLCALDVALHRVDLVSLPRVAPRPQARPRASRTAPPGSGSSASGTRCSPPWGWR